MDKKEKKSGKRRTSHESQPEICKISSDVEFSDPKNAPKTRGKRNKPMKTEKGSINVAGKRKSSKIDEKEICEVSSDGEYSGPDKNAPKTRGKRNKPMKTEKGSINVAEKRKSSKIDEKEICEVSSDGEYSEPILKPMQPTLPVELLAPFINRVYPKSSSQWADSDVEELGKLMANRDGFNCTNQTAISEAALSGKIDWFFGQYVDLYQSNPHFEELIDPWYVICEGVPDQPPNLYIDSLNAANLYIGGAGLAGNPQEPIQFSQGRNWFLHCPSRETAMTAAAFLHGRINLQLFHTSVIDSRFMSYK